MSWKGQCRGIAGGQIVLPNRRREPDLVLRLPQPLQQATIGQVALLWRADHFELAITSERPPDPAVRTDGLSAGVDLAELNIAAMVTEPGDALVLNRR